MELTGKLGGVRRRKVMRAEELEKTRPVQRHSKLITRIKTNKQTNLRQNMSSKPSVTHVFMDQQVVMYSHNRRLFSLRKSGNCDMWHDVHEP